MLELHVAQGLRQQGGSLAPGVGQFGIRIRVHLFTVANQEDDEGLLDTWISSGVVLHGDASGSRQQENGAGQEKLNGWSHRMPSI